MYRNERNASGPGRRTWVALVVAVCLGAGVAVDASAATVGSYQFVVTAPDIEYASELAQQCERIRERVQRRLSTRGPWAGTASVVVVRRTAQSETGPESIWDVRVSRDGVTKSASGVWFEQVEDVVRWGVCYHVLRDVAQSAAANHDGSLRDQSIPLWLSAGLAELVGLEGRLDLFVSVAGAIDEKRSFLLEDLFDHGEQFESEEQRGVFLQQAATVVDFLLSTKQGPHRLRQSLEGLWRRSSATFSLRWEYRDLFPTVEAMASAWEQYVRERPAHLLTEERLTLAETDALLAQILAVEIPVIDEATIEQSVVQTDFDGLSRHENRQVVQKICNEKLGQLLELTLRSAPEFKPALESYRRALEASAASHRRRFRRWYKRAQREHATVRALPYFRTSTEE